MPFLYITEYAKIASDGAGQLIAAPEEPALRAQVVDFGLGVALSAEFTPSTRFVRLHTDTKCNVIFGDNSIVAKGTDTPISADAPEHFGASQKARYVSVIAL